MPDEIEPSQAVAMMTKALEWAYDHATAAIPGIGDASELAEKHLKRNQGRPAKAIDELIAWQVGYAGATGFLSNIGGLVTLPVAIPANLASVLLIQLRMVAAIAHLKGYKIEDERVRTLSFICLTGSAATTLLQEFGIDMGKRLSARLVMQISGTALARINHAVGFQLVTKTGTAGLVNLSKVVPLVGGVVGGAFDATVTRGIGAVAKKVFKSPDDDSSADPPGMVEPLSV